MTVARRIASKCRYNSRCGVTNCDVRRMDLRSYMHFCGMNGKYCPGQSKSLGTSRCSSSSIPGLWNRCHGQEKRSSRGLT
eukprot:8907175-Karenia_brevis.AAC.1